MAGHYICGVAHASHVTVRHEALAAKGVLCFLLTGVASRMIPKAYMVPIGWHAGARGWVLYLLQRLCAICNLCIQPPNPRVQNRSIPPAMRMHADHLHAPPLARQPEKTDCATCMCRSVDQCICTTATLSTRWPSLTACMDTPAFPGVRSMLQRQH